MNDTRPATIPSPLLPDEDAWRRLAACLARRARTLTDPLEVARQLYQRGEILATELGDEDGGLAACEAALDALPGHLQAFLTLRDLSISRDDPTLAAHLFERLGGLLEAGLDDRDAAELCQSFLLLWIFRWRDAARAGQAARWVESTDGGPELLGLLEPLIADPAHRRARLETRVARLGDPESRRRLGLLLVDELGERASGLNWLTLAAPDDALARWRLVEEAAYREDFGALADHLEALTPFVPQTMAAALRFLAAEICEMRLQDPLRADMLYGQSRGGTLHAVVGLKRVLSAVAEGPQPLMRRLSEESEQLGEVGLDRVFALRAMHLTAARGDDAATERAARAVLQRYPDETEAAEWVQRLCYQGRRWQALAAEWAVGAPPPTLTPTLTPIPGDRAMRLVLSALHEHARFDSETARGGLGRKSLAGVPRIERDLTLLRALQRLTATAPAGERVRAWQYEADISERPERRADLFLKIGRTLLRHTNEHEKGLTYLFWVLDQQPENLTALRLIESVCRARGSYKPLAEILSRELMLIDRPDERYPLARELGAILDTQMGDTEGAIARYRQALADCPGDGLSVRELSNLYARLGRIDAVETLLHDRLRREIPSPERVEILLRLAELAHARDPGIVRALLDRAGEASRDPAVPDTLRQALQKARARHEARGDHVVPTLDASDAPEFEVSLRDDEADEADEPTRVDPAPVRTATSQPPERPHHGFPTLPPAPPPVMPTSEPVGMPIAQRAAVPGLLPPTPVLRPPPSVEPARGDDPRVEPAAALTADARPARARLPEPSSRSGPGSDSGQRSLPVPSAALRPPTRTPMPGLPPPGHPTPVGGFPALPRLPRRPVTQEPQELTESTESTESTGSTGPAARPAQVEPAAVERHSWSESAEVARPAREDPGRAVILRKLRRAKGENDAPATADSEFPDLGDPHVRAAIASLSRAADAPEKAEAAAALGRLYDTLGQTEPAMHAWRTALSWRAGDPEAEGRLGLLLSATGQSAALADLRARQAERTGDPLRRRVLRAEAVALHIGPLGDPVGALRLVRMQAEDTAGLDLDMAQQVCDALAAAGAYGQMPEVLLLLQAAAPTAERAARLGQVLLNRLNRPHDALPHLESAARAQVRDAIADLAVCRAALGDTESALRLLSEGALDGTERASVRLNLARLLEKQGASPDRIRTLYIEALDAGVRDIDMLDAVEQIAVGQKDWPLLARIVETRLSVLLTPDGRDAVDSSRRDEVRDLSVRLGHVYYKRLDRPHDAVRAFLRAWRLQPSDQSLYRVIEGLLSRAPAPELQIELYSSYLALARPAGRERVAAALKLSGFLEEVGRVEAACDLLGDLPHTPEVLATLERLYPQAERWTELAQLLRQRLDGQTENRLPLLRRLAQTLETGLRDLPGATDVWRSILEAETGPIDTPPGPRPSGPIDTRPGSRPSGPIDMPPGSRPSGPIDTRPGPRPSGPIALAGSPPNAAPPESLNTIRALCRLLEAQKRWSELVEMSERELALCTDRRQQAYILFRMGSLQETQLGQADAAGRNYRRALELDARCFPALHGLRELAAVSGRWVTVIQYLAREVELWEEPRERASVLARIAEIHETHLNDRDEALAHYRRAVGIYPACLPAVRALADDAVNREAWEEAAPYFQVLSNQNLDKWPRPQRAEVFARRGLVAVRLGRTIEATECLKLALDLNPDHLDALALLVEAQGAGRRDTVSEELLTRLEGAIATAAKADDVPRHARLVALRGQLHRNCLELDAAERCFSQAAQLCPTDLTLLRPLVELYLADRRFAPATRALHAFVERCPAPERGVDPRIAALLWEGEIFSDFAVDPGRALECYRRVLNLEDGHQEALFRMAQCQYLQGRYHDARESMHLLLAVAADSDTSPERRAPYHFYMGRIAQIGFTDHPGAAEQYHAALALDPRCHAASLALLRLWEGQGQRETVDRYLADHPEILELPQKPVQSAGLLLAYVARIRQDRGDRAGARQVLLALTEREGPTTRDARFALVRMSAHLTNPAEATEHLSRLLDRDICDIEALRSLAELVQRHGDDERLYHVLSALELLRALRPEDEARFEALRERVRKTLEKGVRPLPDALLGQHLHHPAFESPIVKVIGPLDPALAAQLGGRMLPPDVRRTDRLVTAVDLKLIQGVTGTKSFDVLSSASSAQILSVIPGDRPTIVLGEAGASELGNLHRRFAVARAASYIRAGLTRVHDIETERAVELLRLLEGLFTASADGTERGESLLDLVPKRVSDVLRPEIERHRQGTLPALYTGESALTGIMRTADRFGLMACGELRPCIEYLARGASALDIPAGGDLTWAIRGRARVQDLIKWALSESHHTLRRSVGLGI